MRMMRKRKMKRVSLSQISMRMVYKRISRRSMISSKESRVAGTTWTAMMMMILIVTLIRLVDIATAIGKKLLFEYM